MQNVSARSLFLNFLIKLMKSKQQLDLCFFVLFLASAKTLSGLLEWECKTDAVEALTALNHYQIRVPSKYNCVIIIQWELMSETFTII